MISFIVRRVLIKDNMTDTLNHDGLESGNLGAEPNNVIDLVRARWAICAGVPAVRGGEAEVTSSRGVDEVVDSGVAVVVARVAGLKVLVPGLRPRFRQGV